MRLEESAEKKKKRLKLLVEFSTSAFRGVANHFFLLSPSCKIAAGRVNVKLVSRIKQREKKMKNVLLDQMLFLAGNQLSRLPQRLPLGIPEASAKEREVIRVNKEDPTK